MNIRLFILCMISCLCSLGMRAQQVADSVHLQVADWQVRRAGGKVEIRFSVALDSLKIPSNRQVTLMPVLVHGDSLRTLPALVIAGHRRAILHRRRKGEGILLEADHFSQKTYPYAVLLDDAAWMNGATLTLTQDVCGCGGHPLSRHVAATHELFWERPVYVVQPVLAFMAPAVESIKMRQESGRAYLDFPVNRTVIYPEYRRNKEELAKIRHTIEVVRNDTNTHITHISIHGYASPEGSWVNNRRLASGRAEALKRYVCEQYQFADTLFTVASTPEDWKGLKAWVEHADFPEKAQVLAIIASSDDEDAKNTRLQQLHGGDIYARLLREVYPALRHSDYTVHYTVRAFNMEEAKRLLKQRPQLLSLDEMYRVASTYPVGSESFNEVFDIAVRLFPEDETANLNAALIAISEQQYDKAEGYLKKAGDSPLAIHARGVWCLMTKRYEEASVLLKTAQQQGVHEAGDNLKQLERKLADNQEQL